MSTYVAERYLPGVTPEQLLDAARRAKLATAQMTAAGTPVTDLRSTSLTGTRPATACSKAPPSRPCNKPTTPRASPTNGSSPPCTWPPKT